MSVPNSAYSFAYWGWDWLLTRIRGGERVDCNKKYVDACPIWSLCRRRFLLHLFTMGQEIFFKLYLKFIFYDLIHDKFMRSNNESWIYKSWFFCTKIICYYLHLRNKNVYKQIFLSKKNEYCSLKVCILRYFRVLNIQNF